MEEYLSESVVARRFLALRVARVEQIRAQASSARAEAARGAAGKAAVNVLGSKTAAQWQVTDGKTRSADTTGQEPAMG
jgi:hypothetical protein